MAGAATVGQLVISLAADVAQLRTDMSAATAVVEAGGQAIDRAASMAKTALIGMAAALGPAALADMIGTTIAATAALDNMAARTGMSVESLSALRSIANIVGADFDQIGQGATKLAKAMYEASTNGGKTAEAFNLLGVQIKNVDGTLRATDDVLLDVAKSFAAMEDGATKTALAQILLGKSGAQLIEVLNELGKAGEYQVKITAQQAAQAEELERDWARIGAAGKELRTIVINEMVPAMDALLQSWLDFINEGGGIRGAIKEWAADGTLQAWFRAAGLELAKLMDALVDFKNLFVAWGETIASAMGLLKGVWDQLAGGAAILAGQWQTGMALIRQGSELNKEALYGLADAWGKNTEFSTKFQDSYTKNLILIDTTTAAIKDQGPALHDNTVQWADYTKAIDTLAQQLAKLTGADGGYTQFQKAMDQIAADQAAGKSVSIEQAAAYLAIAGELDNLVKWQKQYDEVLKITIDDAKAEDKAIKDWNATILKALDSYKAFYAAMGDVIDASNEEVRTFGFSAEALRDLAVIRKINVDLEKELSQLAVDGAEDARAAAIARAEEAKQTLLANNAKLDLLRNWQNILGDGTSATSDFLLDFVHNGEDAFKRLWTRFKDWALEALAEIAAKQIVVSIVGMLGLGGAAEAAAGSLGTGGAGGQLLSLLGMGGSAAGGLGGSLGAFAGGVASPIGTIQTLLGMEGGATIGAGMGLEAALGAAVPVVGGLFAAYSLAKAFGLFGSKGGPMTREFGLSGGDLSGFGDFSALHKLVGTDASQTAGMDTMAGGLSAQYAAVLKALGATGSASFGVYSSMDPKGTAPSNVDVRAVVGGTQVYAGDNFNVGRTAEDVEKELKNQAAQALLAALKASNVSDIVKAFLGEVTATGDTIDKIIEATIVLTKLPADLQAAFVDAVAVSPEMLEKLSAFNAAFVELQDAVDAGDAAVKKFATGVDESTETIYDKALRLSEGMVGLIDAYDGSTEGTQALTQGTAAYVQALSAALNEISQIRTGLATMFGDSIQNIKLAALTEQQRADFLKREALANIELLKQTTDPRQIEKLAKIVNEDLLSVFRMLSPEQQRAQQQWFIDKLTETGNIADANLIASGEALLSDQETGRQILETLREQMTAAARMQYEAAVALGKAAGTFTGSVADFDAIAKKPVAVTVTVNDKKNTTPVDNYGSGGAGGYTYNPGYNTPLVDPYIGGTGLLP